VFPRDLCTCRGPATRCFGVALLLAFWLCTHLPPRLFAEDDLRNSRHFRRPVAAVLLPEGNLLAVANQRSGTLSQVDLRAGEVRQELKVGKHLSALALVPGRNELLATDEASHELVLLNFKAGSLSVRSRLPVNRCPVSVAVSDDGRFAVVGCQWSRCVQIVEFRPQQADSTADLAVGETIPLPFAPRPLRLLPGGEKVLVADAFAGQLAVIDIPAGRLQNVQQITGHNIAGLYLSDDRKAVFVSHQILAERLPTTRENIAAGRLMRNMVRRIPLALLENGNISLDENSQLISLGTRGHGAGDPSGLLVAEGNRLAVTLAGTQELALIHAALSQSPDETRIRVGHRPTFVLGDSAGEMLIVGNTLDDSLSVIDPRKSTIVHTISLGPQPEWLPQDRGERLFYDARLSRDGWLSCHSCHSYGHTNGLLADTNGDGTFGTPKRTLTLLGTRLTYRWAWNGKIANLHEQVEKSQLETMHGERRPFADIIDLTSFLHTLPPPPPVAPDPVDDKDAQRLVRGRDLFGRLGCVECHIPPLVYSSHESYNVGLVDERGLNQFNPPSLRGVSQQIRYFHDNSAESLPDVFREFGHPGGTVLTDEELADLVRFLRSL